MGDLKQESLHNVSFRGRELITLETFAPVVHYESIRILLAMTARENYEITKFDIKTAFLNGDLQEELYMKLPEGFINEENGDLICRLRRSLYGLKQSPRCWNEKFVGFLKNFNFKSIESEKCVFVGVFKGFKVYLALYVDDGLAKFGMENASQSSVPAEPGLHLTKSSLDKNHCIPYREAVGSLLFAARVCLQISNML